MAHSSILAWRIPWTEEPGRVQSTGLQRAERLSDFTHFTHSLTQTSGGEGTTEDEMVGWHHRLNGHEFEQALRVGDGQGSLACCSLWGRKESYMTE